MKFLPITLFLVFIAATVVAVPGASAQESCGGVFDQKSELYHTPEFKSLSVATMIPNPENPMSFQIADLRTVPGNSVIDNKPEIEKQAQSIRNKEDLKEISITLNLVTDLNGKAVSFDIWSGTMALAAYYKAGAKVLSDIPAEKIRLLRNGVNVNDGVTKVRQLYAFQVKQKNFKSLISIGKITKKKLHLQISPTVSNADLGATEDFATLYRRTFHERQPRIGFIIGTFDPLHENHINMAKAAIEGLGLDQVIFIANDRPAHKPGATALKDRLDILQTRLNGEKDFNFYQSPTYMSVQELGVEFFVRRIKTLFGTNSVYQIIGDEALQTQYEKDYLPWDGDVRYIAIPRDYSQIPESIAQRVDRVILPTVNSSTSIRQQISKGEDPPTTSLHPDVLQLIKNKGLYRTK